MTNIALRECTGDWCVYIQGDEVLHEATIPAMRATMERELNNPQVQGLLVDYTHFYGSFWTEVYLCLAGITRKFAWCGATRKSVPAAMRRDFAPWTIKNCA